MTGSRSTYGSSIREADGVRLDELLPEVPVTRPETLTDDNSVGKAAFDLLKTTTVYANLAAGLLPTSVSSRTRPSFAR
jgi:hypothetical protein